MLLAATTHARTLADVLTQVGPAARARLAIPFAAAKLPYPPRRVTLLALKKEMRLELWAEGPQGGPRCVRDYTILGASGITGPKLRRGDLQTPEGIYTATWLNPNSAGYLGIKIDYPNAFDRREAAKDRHRDPGGDIYVHGHWYSTGCLAMGDPAIEELFILAHDTGLARVSVILAPWDLRALPPPKISTLPWTQGLYARLSERLKRYR
jgi:murein L,D-transpeptidase YafK